MKIDLSNVLLVLGIVCFLSGAFFLGITLFLIAGIIEV